MLVIGIQEDKAPFHAQLDIDVDADSARKIHDLLSKKAKGTTFSHIICVEDDEVVGEFEEGSDFDLSQPEETSDDQDEDEENPDGLHEDTNDLDLDTSAEDD